MTNTPYRGNGLADTPEEELLLVHVALGLLGLVLASAGVIWLKGIGWLVEHQVLAPSASHPVVQLPRAGGAGLDVPRLAILAAVLVALLAIGLSSARRAIKRRREDLA